MKGHENVIKNSQNFSLFETFQWFSALVKDDIVTLRIVSSETLFKITDSTNFWKRLLVWKKAESLDE